MNPATSTCERHFGHADFDLSRLEKTTSQILCPVAGCSAAVVQIPYGKQQGSARAMPWCHEHGIRIHSNTFVYWNGPGLQDESRLRNFIVRPDLALKIALPKGMKAESHRLGFEMSEDALSWNVFVCLAEAGRLRQAAQFLTGRELRQEPRMFMWGRQVTPGDGQGLPYAPLLKVRDRLEEDITNFWTEPDIMLVADGELVISIEAKFGSGNTLAVDREAPKGAKPTARAGLLDRYLGARTSVRTRAIIEPALMGARLHSQLFRNVVFASEMAADVPWHVVNLVSSTQCRSRDDQRYTFTDPTDEVCAYLHPDCQQCFTYRTWEGLHAKLIKDDQGITRLDQYLRGKSAHFLPAFNLS